MTKDNPIKKPDEASSELIDLDKEFAEMIKQIQEIKDNIGGNQTKRTENPYFNDSDGEEKPAPTLKPSGATNQLAGKKENKSK